MNIELEIEDIFSGVVDSFVRFQKKIEQTTISYVLAPAKLSEIYLLKKKYIESVQEQVEETQLVLSNIAEQMDKSIQGKFSERVNTVLKEKRDEYNLIFK